ncbi:MAG TPA: SDR family oxidoreductase [Candidatus Methylacidiphilales bacterium]|nr:SDR family oxidoreductase [Candidatus Methylacidiphilales bacterium]
MFAELTQLTGQTAVITGAAGRLGSVFCKILAELGADVILLDQDIARAEALAESLRTEFGHAAHVVPVDLEKESEVRAAANAILRITPKLEILINSAALVGTTPLIGWGVPFEQQNVDTWRRALEVNLTAAFTLTQALTPGLRSSGNGRIINISSIYGVAGPDFGLYEGLPGMGNPAAYAASKGGIIQLTRWLSTALAPEIRVNCISPGGVEAAQPAPFIARYEAKTPLKRMANPTDIAGAAAFLATDLSRYVTGQNLIVDGGWTVW